MNVPPILLAAIEASNRGTSTTAMIPVESLGTQVRL